MFNDDIEFVLLEFHTALQSDFYSVSMVCKQSKLKLLVHMAGFSKGELVQALRVTAHLTGYCRIKDVLILKSFIHKNTKLYKYF